MRRRSGLGYLALSEEEEPGVNLTPLIDVLFVVLFAFMIAAPLLEYEKIELAESRTEKQSFSPLQTADPIRLYVDSQDRITINKKEVQLKTLPELLQLIRQRTAAKASLQLYQDKKATFGTYQAIKSAAEQAGFKELEVFLTTP